MRGAVLYLVFLFVPWWAAGQSCEPAAFDREYQAVKSLMRGNYPRELAACIELVDRYRGTRSICEARSMVLLARAKWSNGDYNQSVELLRHARSIAGAAEASFSSAIDDLMADNFYYQAYYDSAIKYYKAASATLEKAGLTSELAHIQHKLAVMYHRKGEMSSALRYLYKSEELKGAFPGGVHDLADFGGSTLLFNDTLYYRAKIKEERQQLATFRQAGNREGEFTTLLNLGIAYRQLGLHLTSARYMAKGARLMSDLGKYPLWYSAGREYGIAGMKDSCFYFHYLAKAASPTSTRIKQVTMLEMLGDSHALFDNLDSATWYLERAYEMNLVMNNRVTLPGVAGKLASVYYRKGNRQRAEELLALGIKQGRGTSRQHLLKLYEFAKQYYSETGDPSRALAFSNQAQALSDSINRIEGALALVYYQAHFESVRKERELKEAQLKVRNRTIILTSLACFSILMVAWGVTLFVQRKKIKRQNLLLQESNAEQRALTQEVHHRVKNNLQFIVSLLNLQLKNMDDTASARLVDEIKNRIVTMGAIHQRFHHTQGAHRVDMEPFVADLVANLLHAMPTRANITRDVRIDPLQLDVDSAISVGLLVNELVTNAVKHAFQAHPAPAIKVFLQQRKDEIVLSISDNGSGFRFASGGSGFGMRLMELLIRKLKASWHQPDLNTLELKFSPAVPSHP